MVVCLSPHQSDHSRDKKGAVFMTGTKRGWLLGAAALSSGLLLTACNTGNSMDRFIVGQDGLILASTDGGATLTPQTSHTSNDLHSVSFTGTQHGCAVGDSGTVVRTTNAGTTWAKTAGANVHTEENLRSIDTQWTFSYTGPNIAGNVPMAAPNGLTFYDHGLAVGDNGVMIVTADGCQHWTKLSSGVSDDLKGVALDRNWSSSAYVVGQHGVILKTSNFGTSWTQQTSGTVHDLRGVWAASSNVWAVGEHGVIVYTTNGGTTWTPKASGVTTRLNSVSFNGPQGYIVGENGVILHTTDFGANWTAQTSNTTRELRSVSTVNGTDAIIAGDHGTVLTTTNSGTTWTPRTSGTTKTLRGAV
jgi:photosystem II stability/assembly factor-like uncharacterized protein